MEALSIREFIQKLQHGRLGRGERRRPVQMTQGLDGKAGLQRIGGDALAGLHVPAKACQASRDRIVAKQTGAAVKDEADRQGQLLQPRRRRLFPVKVNFGLLAGEIVGKALELERRTAANDNRDLEQRLKRDDRLLPAQCSSGTAVNAGSRLFQPAEIDILLAERAVVAMLLKPCRVHQEPLVKLLLQLV